MTRNLVTPGFSALLGRFISRQDTARRHRNLGRRRGRSGQVVRAVEALEGRVVPVAVPFGGPSLLGTLASVGVETGPVVPVIQPASPIGILTPSTAGGVTMTSSSATGTLAQLGNDWKALITELQSLAAKSGVTVADLESLALDSQSISEAGFHFDGSSLHTVISELAMAVAGGTSTSQAQSDWTALFNSSSVSGTVVTNTFNDLVKAIQDSGVTTTDLTTVASDEAAIESDLSNLRHQIVPGTVSGMDPSTLVSSSSLPSISVTLPNIPAPASASAAVQSAVNSVPAVSQSFIAGPGVPTILPWGVNLLSSLSHVGVVTGPVVALSPRPLEPASIPTSIQGSKFQQLFADEQALNAELQSLASKSGVTVAELESLAVDGQSIAQAGVHLAPSSLNPVISELAAAVAGGTSTSQAQSDWTALFTGSSVSSALIASAFNDLVAAITSSHVTTTDLTTVANDEAAIQNDLKNLFSGNNGTTGTGTTGTGTTGTGTTGTGTTGTKGSGTGPLAGGSKGTGQTSKSTTAIHKLVETPKGHGTVRSAVLHAKLAKAAHKRA